MKKTILAVLLALACLAPSCKNGATPFKWPELAKCAPDAGTLVGTVSQIFFTDFLKDGSFSQEGKDKLQNLAMQHGGDVVMCVVNRLAKDWSSPGASVTPERTAAYKRASDFLREAGTQFE